MISKPLDWEVPRGEKDVASSILGMVEGPSGLVVVALIASIAAIFWMLLFFQFTVDDAFIVFRYGKTLSQHHIWNWNPTGAPSEAYTSAIYALLSVVPPLIHLPPSLVYKWAGLLALAVTLYRAINLANSKIAKALCVLVICLCPYVWIHTLSCLETPLFILLLFEFGICLCDVGVSLPEWTYILAILIPFVRPEGVIFSIVGLILFLCRHQARPKKLSILVLLVFLSVAYFVARAVYFHQLLPNPFYVKLGHSSLRQFISNVNGEMAYLLVLILLAVLARKHMTRLLMLTVLLVLLLVYSPHHLAMNFAGRFYFQWFLSSILIFLVAEDITKIKVPVVIVLLFGIAFSFQIPQLRWVISYKPYLLFFNIDIGKRLAPFAKDHTMILGDAGAIPYFSDWKAYDIKGLCTPEFARFGVTERSLQNMRPDLVFLYSDSDDPESISESGDYPALEREVKSGKYQYIATVKLKPYYLLEYLRKDTPQFERIAVVLRQNVESLRRLHISILSVLEQRYVEW